MTESAERAERFKESSTRYLAPLENQDGSLDFEAHEAAEDLNGFLFAYPGFIGVAPFGSKVRGYSDASSDIDLAIFYDPTKLPQLEDVSENEKFVNEVENWRKLATLRFKKEVKCHIEPVGPAAVWEIVDTLASSRSFDNEFGRFKTFWGYLCGPTVVGLQVSEYREAIKREILKHPESKRELVIKGIANFIIEGEDAAMYQKISKRIPQLTELEKQNLETVRREKWETQIRLALNLDK